MTIDCHAHWIPPPLADALRRRRAVPRIEATPTGERFFSYQGNRPFDAAFGDLVARRAFMKCRGVGMQVLSLAGLFGVDCLPADESAPLVRSFNDAVVEACRDTPEQFAGLASLPLTDISLACSELMRACGADLRGAILPADGFRTLADAARFRPLFEVGERLKCHFLVHPGPTQAPSEVQARNVPNDNAWYRRIVLETQARLSEAMMTLNFSDYLDPYPNVTVQVANLGGTLPFLIERMDEVAREQLESTTLPSTQPSRCYVDTASFGPRAIEMAVACFGADRIVLGTDCPIFDTARSLKSLADARLDAETRERIRFRNAHQLFARAV